MALRAACTAPFASVLVVLLVTVVAFAGAALPALLDDARTATVQRTLHSARTDTLDATAHIRGTPTAGPGTGVAVWDPMRAQLRGIHDRMPQPLRTVTAAGAGFVTLDGQTAMPLDGSARPANRITILLDPDVGARIRIVAGHLPEPDAVDPPVDQIVQVALSREAADTLAWPLGERRRLDFPSHPMTVELVGVYEARRPAESAWTHQRTGLHPDIEQVGTGDVVHLASAYAAPGLLDRLDPWLDATATTVFFPLRADRVAGTQAAVLAAQLRGFAARPQAFSGTFGPDNSALTFLSSAPALLDAGAARGDAMTAIVTLAAIGPLTVAIAAVAMTGWMLAARRVPTVRAARARGAAIGLLAALLAGEGLALAAVGAAVGAASAAAIVGWAGASALVVPVAAVIAAAVACPLAALPAAARRARTDLGVADRPTRIRRLAIEGGVLVAGVAVLLAAALGSQTTVAPVRLAASAAVFAIACVVVLRLVPLLLGAVEAPLARGRGVVALVGPARARRGRTLPVIPVLAALVCVATALFALVASATVASGVEATARARTGADLRVSATQIPDAAIARVRALDGVHAVAPIYADVQLPARGTAQWLTVTVYAVDPHELAAVQHDVPGAVVPPATAPDDAIPAVAAASVVDAAGSGPLVVHGVDVQLTAADSQPAYVDGARWVLVDRTYADRLVGPAPTVHTLLVDLGPEASVATVAAAVRQAVGGDAQTRTPQAEAAQIAADPALQTVRGALAGALAVAAVLFVLTISMTLLRGAPERGRMLGLLSTMGYPRRRELPLVLWEVGPALALSLVVGLGAGLALPPLLLGGVDLTRFVGGRSQPPVVLEGWMPVAVAAGFAAVAAVAVTAAAVVASRSSAAAALRRVDEEVVS
ncbi:FtsX-like permease family protein [Microbacterium luticocti]|uniref:FtsX-like permease family protein n=1 Tax=Microbacterium luticocti TaxID=451764 RepID=UPI0004036F24|nr:FtsX-like permease family protein [Microbacterium luticocti]